MELTLERRLAAILAADVAGFSRQMAVDETGTLARLNQVRTEIIDPKVDQFRGRIVGSAGDSLLVEFNSAVSAVECAVKTQDALASWNESLSEDNRIIFRMGINLGDVIADRDTIFGDGVNIAARLEKLAEPGGVCVAHSVFDQVNWRLWLRSSGSPGRQRPDNDRHWGDARRGSGHLPDNRQRLQAYRRRRP